jgi:hypothetical protein
MKLLYALIVLFASPLAMAKERCSSYWTLVGNIESSVRAYDELILSLKENKAAIRELNSHIRTYGLLQTLGASAKIKGFPNRLEADGPGGPVVGAFLKSMTLPEDSGLSVDTVYEVVDRKAAKALRKWSVPFGSSAPQGVEGNSIFYRHNLAAVCSQTSHPITMKVKTDNHFEASEIKLEEKVKLIPAKDCPAAKNLFKNSSYSTCGELIDLKSGKTRLLVWQTPMT